MKTAYEFYEITRKALKNLAARRGIASADLERYYHTTDKHLDFYKALSGIPLVFAQMAFHAQNAQIIDGFIAFEKNFNIFRDITEGFVPEVFLAKFNSAEQLAEFMANRLGRKNSDMMKRYSNALFASAKYLVKFHSRRDVIDDLLDHGGRQGNSESLIKYFRANVSKGFGIALSCDFLKELDDQFAFLAKPDVHVIDAVCAYNGKSKEDYKDSKEIALVKEMQEIVNEINNELCKKGEKSITVYQFDRMIWLVCSENFFLHSRGNGKIHYINELRG